LTVAAGREVVVMLTGVAAASTVSFSVADAELLLLVLSTTFTANESVVALVAVPVSNPELLNEKPVTAVVNVQV